MKDKAISLFIYTKSHDIPATALKAVGGLAKLGGVAGAVWLECR